jgi:ABC-2 type transport system ATP-binding protein
MTVPPGEAFGFLGPNGAGKTTAVKLLLGLAAPTSGEGWVLGKPLGDRSARRRIGYLPELFRYQGWLSAREVLGLHCELAGLPRPTWAGEVQAALEIVDLAGRAEDRVGTFSKGMQQRLGIGAALLGRPELIFLDEPTSALDPVGRHDVRQIIHSVKERGTAVFLNSHLLTEVEMVCDRVAILDHGKVVASGTLDDLLGGHAVRIRVTGLKPRERASLDSFGEVDDDGEWITVRGLDPERVPDLVDAVVSLGGRLYQVEPRHQTLEDRFLQLLSEQPHPGPPPRGGGHG